MSLNLVTIKAKKELGKAHATFGASGAKRWLKCPGSIALAKKAPPEVESKYAKEGTDAHSCLELFLKNERHKERAVAKLLYATYPEVMVNHAWDAAKAIRELIPEGDVEVLCETRVDSTAYTTRDETDPQFGTVDSAIVEHFGTLYVIDFKYGAGIPVHPENNEQMIYYGVGIARKYHYNFSRVVLVVIQPRRPVKGETIRTWEISPRELRAWEKTFREGVKRAQSKRAPLKAGEHCKFCKAEGICKEKKNIRLRQAQDDFED